MVATPHLGASTAEAQVKVAQEIARSFLDAKQGKPLQGVVSLSYDVTITSHIPAAGHSELLNSKLSDFYCSFCAACACAFNNE